MAFIFPKDEELFLDLDTVRSELPGRMQDILDDARDGVSEDRSRSFGKRFREMSAQLRNENISVEASGKNDYEIMKKMEQKLRVIFNKHFLKLEDIADRQADKMYIGRFPHSRMYNKTFVRESDKYKEEYEVDYFDEMNQATGFMRAPGHVGSFLYYAQKDLEAAKMKARLFSFMSFFIILVGVAVVLAGAQPFEFLPQFMVELMAEDLMVRIVVLALMALTGWILVMGGPPERGVLFKFFANGIFLLLIAIGSTLMAMRNVFSDAPIEAISLLPFGAYYILYGIFSLFNDIAAFFRTKKAKRKAKKDFCTRVENNIQHMHRYIRFHTLWWKTLKGDAQVPYGIRNLEESFAHVLKMYEKYSK